MRPFDDTRTVRDQREYPYLLFYLVFQVVVLKLLNAVLALAEYTTACD